MSAPRFVIESDPLLTLTEVAELLRVSRTTAYNMVRNGTIPSRRVGVQIRVLRSELGPWLTQKKDRP